MTTWSYSSLDAFTTCPRRYKLTRITKEVREQQTAATIHGNEVHKAIEQHIKGEAYLPEKYKQYLPLVNRVKAEPGKRLVEYKFGISASFKPVDYWDKTVWCRGVIDFGVVKTSTAAVLDWKTGKPKPDLDQLHLFAGAVFSHFPHVHSVSTGFAWLAHGKLDTQTFTRDQVNELWGEFLPKVARLEAAHKNDDFPPRPSGLCKAHCPVGRDKCSYSGRG